MPGHHLPPRQEVQDGLSQFRRGNVQPRQRSSFAVDRLWSSADRVSLVICGVLGATIALRATDGCAPLVKAGVTLGYTFLTCFGGGTQSKVLRWAVARASGARAEPLRFPWQEMGNRAFACSGFLLALLLHVTGNVSVLGGEAWRLLMWLNTAYIVACTSVHSGWFASRGAPGIGSPRTWFCAFIDSFGGGFWRDLHSRSVPGALASSNLIPWAAGILLCLWLLRVGNANGQRGQQLVLGAGIPSTTCLYAVFA